MASKLFTFTFTHLSKREELHRQVVRSCRDAGPARVRGSCAEAGLPRGRDGLPAEPTDSTVAEWCALEATVAPDHEAQLQWLRRQLTSPGGQESRATVAVHLAKPA